MSRSGLTLWVRGLAVTLIWAAGTSLAARPARASGCHAPERPVLGLTPSWEVRDEAPAASLGRNEHAGPRLTGIACPGEAARPSGRLADPNLPALLSAGFVALSPTTSRLVVEPGPVSTPDLVESLERPPRA